MWTSSGGICEIFTATMKKAILFHKKSLLRVQVSILLAYGNRKKYSKIMTCSFELQPEYDLVNVFCTRLWKKPSNTYINFSIFPLGKTLNIHFWHLLSTLKKRGRTAKILWYLGLNFKGVGLLKRLCLLFLPNFQGLQ